MAEITVNLQVVGIYVNVQVPMQVDNAGGTVTLAQVMEAAKDPNTNLKPAVDGGVVPDGFTWIAEVNGSLEYAAAYDKKAFNSRSGASRAAGVYKLKERQEPGDIVNAWQYYLFDAKGSFRSKEGGARFRPFLKNQQPIADGWSIIWRRVAVVIKEDAVPPSLANWVRELDDAHGQPR